MRAPLRQAPALRLVPVLAVFAFLLPWASGCEDGGGGGSPANTGDGSGTLRVIATVSCAVLTDSADGIATCPIFYYVNVESDIDGEEEDVDDALVEIGPLGEPPQVLESAGNGAYTGTAVGYGDAYALDVTRGEDYLTGVVLPAPGDFTITVSPDPPEVGEGSVVRWSPHSDSGTAFSQVAVWQLFAGITYQGPAEFDDGAESLPGSTFPASGDYRVDVGRSRVLYLDSPFSTGLVTLGRYRLVTVE